MSLRSEAKVNFTPPHSRFAPENQHVMFIFRLHKKEPLQFWSAKLRTFSDIRKKNATKVDFLNPNGKIFGMMD